VKRAPQQGFGDRSARLRLAHARLFFSDRSSQIKSGTRLFPISKKRSQAPFFVRVGALERMG
jgi:hypothetical protein